MGRGSAKTPRDRRGMASLCTGDAAAIVRRGTRANHGAVQDLPALWNAEQTTNADRKEIIRCLVDRVVVRVSEISERVDVTIHWHEGFTSQHELIRPVCSYRGMATADQLRRRVTELRQEGRTASQIAAILNRGGFSPPRRCNPFSKEQVWQLLARLGLTDKLDVVELGHMSCDSRPWQRAWKFPF